MKNNTNPVDRIKLMMSYDSEKTLNENLNVLNLINEDESMEVDEQRGAISKELKNLGLGAKETAAISAMGKEFNIADNIIATALTKDLTQLAKEVEDAVKKDLKNGVRVSTTETLGPLAKQASKLKAMKEMAQKSQELKKIGKELTTKEITNIIERTKTESKQLARKLESTSAKSTAKTTANTAKEVSADVKKVTNADDAAKVVVNVNTGSVTKEAAAETNAAVQASKEISPEAKAVAEDAKKVVEEMKPSKWQKFKNIVRKLKPKYWILLGLAGVAGWYLWKFLKSLQPQKELFPKCLDSLIDDEGTTIRATSGGDPVVSVTSTGNRDYDQKGGLWFFNNGRVITVDQSKRGYWSCKGSQVTIAEQGDGNPLTGVDNVITIKWDGESAPVKGGGGDGTGETNPKPNKPNYHDCSSKDFPFEFGCISPKIAEVQKCLGVEPQKGYLGPKTISALVNLHFETKDGLTKDVYDKVMAACKESEPKPTEAPKSDTPNVETPKTDNPATAPITPPPAPAEPVFDKNRLQELLASKNLVKKRKGVIVKWKGEELSGEDYFILNKYLEDKGYIQKKQRETGDRDDEDVTMKYKWKQVGETEPEA